MNFGTVKSFRAVFVNRTEGAYTDCLCVVCLIFFGQRCCKRLVLDVFWNCKISPGTVRGCDDSAFFWFLIL